MTAFRPNTKGPEYRAAREKYYVQGKRKERTVVRMICECGHPAERVTGDLVYPEKSEYHRKLFFLCLRCDRYVGCHSGSGIPLGTLANQEVRRLRSTAHHWFDRLWKEFGSTRQKAYSAMKEAIGVRHIGWEQEAGCKAVIEWAQAEVNKRKMQRVKSQFKKEPA